MPFNTQTEYHRYQRYFTNISRLYQKREVKIYMGLILTFATITFFAIFALRPTITTIASLIQELETQKQIDNQLQTKINALGQAQKNYNQLANAFLIEDALPTQSGLEQLLYNLEYLIKQNGLTIRSLSFNPIVINGIPTENQIGFAISVSGSKDSLNQLLDSFYNLRRVITIDSTTFSKSQKILEAEGDTQKSSDINLNISGSAYFLYKSNILRVNK
jgi:Tfp pilus assembly protein PilO